MAKFKVGDKVRGNDQKRYGITNDKMLIGEVVAVYDKPHVNDVEIKIIKHADNLCVGDTFQLDSRYFDLIQPSREFIVIHRDGNVMTAEHRVNRDVIKSAKATCAPSDTFDLDTGAKLAFDRLMNRQNIEEAVKAWNEPAPQPAHRFKVGDRVVRDDSGVGVIKRIVDEKIPYLVEWENGERWHIESVLSPAPEPPKYIPQIGDRVVTNFGIGSVIRISGSGEAGVWHDTWDEGHNFHGIFDGLSGDRGWWVNYSNVEPLMVPSDV